MPSRDHVDCHSLCVWNQAFSQAWNSSPRGHSLILRYSSGTLRVPQWGVGFPGFLAKFLRQDAIRRRRQVPETCTRRIAEVSIESFIPILLKPNWRSRDSCGISQACTPDTPGTWALHRHSVGFCCPWGGHSRDTLFSEAGHCKAKKFAGFSADVGAGDPGQVTRVRSTGGPSAGKQPSQT